jgi:hypothetical protein
MPIATNALQRLALLPPLAHPVTISKIALPAPTFPVVVSFIPQSILLSSRLPEHPASFSAC